MMRFIPYLAPLLAALVLLLGDDERLLVALLLLLGFAVAFDQVHQRIPNLISLGGWLLGLVAHALLPEGQGLLFALGGLTTGVALTLPLHLLRVMGAGDVKLAGAMGAFLGASTTFGAILAAFACGGVLALLVAGRRNKLRDLTINMQILFFNGLRGVPEQARGLPSVGKFPYALALLLGTVTAIWLFPRLDISIF